MAIDPAYFHYLSPLLNELGAHRSLKVACLSYPDLLLPPSGVANRLVGLAPDQLQVRDDSDKICAWHGITPAIQVTDTASLFAALGHAVDFFDIKPFRGPEIIVDLNEPLPSQYEGKYDLVIDTGTLEHCFNVGVAFVGMCRLVAVGGVVLTQAPMTKINHGFWNFSPCVYENFFKQNSWDLKYLYTYFKQDGAIKQFNPSANGRFTAPTESIIIACASRQADATLSYPIQAKYIQNV
jgi:hypothetical protein